MHFSRMMLPNERELERKSKICPWPWPPCRLHHCRLPSNPINLPKLLKMEKLEWVACLMMLKDERALAPSVRFKSFPCLRQICRLVGLLLLLDLFLPTCVENAWLINPSLNLYVIILNTFAPRWRWATKRFLVICDAWQKLKRTIWPLQGLCLFYVGLVRLECAQCCRQLIATSTFFLVVFLLLCIREIRSLLIPPDFFPSRWSEWFDENEAARLALIEKDRLARQVCPITFQTPPTSTCVVRWN